MALTDAQFEERRAYLGGTDAAALAGVNPPRWAQPIDVYLEKIGDAPPRAASTKMMALGSLMEDLVAQLASEATGLIWRRPSRPSRSRRYPWAGGHVDRLAPGALLECKWTQRGDGWGPSHELDADGSLPASPPKLYVPLHYLVQVQHYLAVTEKDFAILAVLIGYADFRWYLVERSPQLIGWLMELEEAFWHDHVLARVPPEPDGSESYGRMLRRQYPDSADLELIATPEQQALALQLRSAINNQRAAERARARIEQELQASMRDAERLVFPEGSISWKRQRPALKVEWEALATSLAHAAYSDDEAALIRRTAWAPDAPDWPKTKKAQGELIRDIARRLELAHEEPGARPFKPSFSEDEEPADATA